MSRQKNLDPSILKMSDKITDPELTAKVSIYDTMRNGVIPIFNSKEERQIFEKVLDGCRSSKEIKFNPEAEMQKFLLANAKNPESTEGHELEAAITVDGTIQPSFNDLDQVNDLESFEKAIIANKKKLITQYGKLQRCTLTPTKAAAGVFKKIVATCDSIKEKDGYSRILFLFASIYTTTKFHCQIHSHNKDRRDLITAKRSTINKLFRLGLVSDEPWNSRMFWTTLDMVLKMDLEATPSKTPFSIYREDFMWLKHAYTADESLVKPVIKSLILIFNSLPIFRENSKNKHFHGRTNADRIEQLKDYNRKLNLNNVDYSMVGSGYLSITDDKPDKKTRNIINKIQGC